MFDMTKIGRSISDARKKKNLTQMALANQLNVSYQAVSNWERGVAMPDISNLTELAAILEVSVDDILGKHSSVIEKAIENETKRKECENKRKGEDGMIQCQGKLEQVSHHFAQLGQRLGQIGGKRPFAGNGEETSAAEPDIAEELTEAAPILRPSQLEQLIDDNIRQVDIEAIKSFLPFVSDEFCDSLFTACMARNDIQAATSIAPFASEDAIDEQIRICYQKNGLDAIHPLFPFAFEDTLAQLADEEYRQNGLKTLSSLAPFLDEDYLDALVTKAMEENGLESVQSLLPFISNEALNRIADAEYRKNGINALNPIAPFLDSEILEIYLKKSFQM